MRPIYWISKDAAASAPAATTATKQESSPSTQENEMQQYIPEIIEVVENTIYFYADIDREKVLRLNKAIHTVTNDLLWRAQITNNKPADIYLHINSHGGSLLDSFSVIDTIINSKIPVHTVIDGCAASGATLISIVGKRRFIKRHSYFLIHQLSAFMFGKYIEFQDEMTNLDTFMEMIRGVYKEHTRIPMKKLNEILKHDLWFNAQQALDLGLVDEII